MGYPLFAQKKTEKIDTFTVYYLLLLLYVTLRLYSSRILLYVCATAILATIATAAEKFSAILLLLLLFFGFFLVLPQKIESIFDRSAALQALTIGYTHWEESWHDVGSLDLGFPFIFLISSLLKTKFTTLHRHRPKKVTPLAALRLFCTSVQEMLSPSSSMLRKYYQKYTPTIVKVSLSSHRSSYCHLYWVKERRWKDTLLLLYC